MLDIGMKVVPDAGTRPIRFGEIGVGYWGGNLVRNLVQMSATEMCLVADLDRDRLAHVKALYPGLETTRNYRDILDAPDIDAVAIATPVDTHFALASEALEAGKHVFVEKPITSTSSEAARLANLARRQGLICMCGHTFLYTPAVERLKELIQSGEIGELQYINSQRLSLGLLQRSCNVVHDLAPHDISIICSLMDSMPEAVNAVGAAYINPAMSEVASITMHYGNGVVAFIQDSWLDPLKTRKLTLIGSRKMVVYNDIEPTDKIQIHDKSVERPIYSDTFEEFAYSYKYGDIVIPRLPGGEPIRRELEHMVDCIRGKEQCRTSVDQGLRVIRIIEAINESIANNGARIDLPQQEWI
jgi:predicted dehydrogenase